MTSLENPEKVREIDYGTMECSNCGNKPLLGCEPEQIPAVHREECGKVCDLWCPTDYFDYTNAHPLFRAVNVPIVSCDRCEGTGQKTWKHRESKHHSSGCTTKCPYCGGTGKVEAWP